MLDSADSISVTTLQKMKPLSPSISLAFSERDLMSSAEQFTSLTFYCHGQRNVFTGTAQHLLFSGLIYCLNQDVGISLTNMNGSAVLDATSKWGENGETSDHNMAVEFQLCSSLQ